jgi:CBS domain-containing protein
MTAKSPYRLRVIDVLSKDVITVSADDTLQTALELMAENRVTALPVVDDKGRCAGILSASDFVEITREITEGMHDVGRTDEESYQWLRENLADHDMARRTVSEFMSENVATVSAQYSLAEAAADMLRHRVHRLPVVDSKGGLLGILSTMDILRAFVAGAPERQSAGQRSRPLSRLKTKRGSTRAARPTPGGAARRRKTRGRS